MSILNKNVQFEGERTNIYIEDNLISEIGSRTEANTIIEADGLAAFPGQMNTRRPKSAPMHNAIANLVHAASGSVVDTTFCDGRILMLHGKIGGEENILMNAEKAALYLIGRTTNGG